MTPWDHRGMWKHVSELLWIFKRSSDLKVPSLPFPTESVQSAAESTYSIPLEQKAKVREFLEEIISEMIGGPLDEVPVTQLHSEPECKCSPLRKPTHE